MTTDAICILAQGPSARGVDTTPLLAADIPLLAVKGTMFTHLQQATWGFGLDMPRLREWRDRIGALRPLPVWWAVPAEQLGAATNPPLPPNLLLIPRLHGGGLSTDIKRGVCAGGSSGHGALNMAYLLLSTQPARRRILLLGYDHRPDSEGRWHVNSGHAKRRHQSPRNWRQWADNFQQIAVALAARGVEVVNGSPDSLITEFPRTTPERGIQWLTRSASS